MAAFGKFTFFKLYRLSSYIALQVIQFMVAEQKEAMDKP